MADRSGLIFVGFIFATVTLAVMLATGMVVKGYADGAYSLDVIAAGVSPGRHLNPTLKGYKILAVCLDAKRGKLYTRSYRYHGKRWLPCGPSRVVLLAEMDQGLRKRDGLFSDEDDPVGVVPRHEP